jgi:hypothetical protein
MNILTTEVYIRASHDRVWRILADFARYPEWNPFIKGIEGNPKVGKRIKVLLTPPGTRALALSPRVLVFTAGKELRWIGHLLFPGLFDGEHSFRLTDLGDGRTRFVQEERFTGILIPFLSKMLNDNTRRGFEAMNAKLKSICESGIDR